MRAALTEPIFGSTKRTSRTRAVLTHGGGSARICASSIFLEASSFFSSALAVRTSFACSRARSRCSRDLPGTPAPALLSATLRFSSQNRLLVKRARSGDRSWPSECASPGASKSLIEHIADVPNTVSPQKSSRGKAEPNLRTPPPHVGARRPSSRRAREEDGFRGGPTRKERAMAGAIDPLGQRKERTGCVPRDEGRGGLPD